ncbi:MAG TPA: EAL domain-containing protein [Frankiaceae bacterium]|nr:EAL domain-containing protein [Frankiaceae bacterium]
MGKQRSGSEQQIAELLQTARRALHLSVAFLSRLDGTTQHLEVVEAPALHSLVFREGVAQPQSTTFCQATLDGKLPAVMPDLRKFPVAMALPAARIPRIRSFVSVPVRLSDGTLYGTFCAAGLTSDKELNDRDQALMEVLASAAAVIIEPGVRTQARAEDIRSRLAPVLAAGGPTVVLQPIVDLSTGHRVGAEALSRFPADWDKAPDTCFAEGHSVGLGDALEIAALRTAAEHLAVVDGYVTMNVSPGTLQTTACQRLLEQMPLERVVLELSEHESVGNYHILRDTLAPLRARGMRLAIDDVGAGFSSLRHIVLTAPDIIKLDRSLVTGLGEDQVLRTLVRSLVDFGHGSNATVVAEGVETASDADHLRRLDVDFGQGWYHGRPGPPEALSPVSLPVPRPGEHDDMDSCNTIQRHT